MKNHKILLTTILVGIVSVSTLSGCNNQTPPTDSGSGSNSPDSKTEVATLKTVKFQLQNLRGVITEETTQSFLESEKVKNEWETFKEEYQEYQEYVNNLEVKQRQIVQPFQNFIENKINKLDSIFFPQDEQTTRRNQQDNLVEVKEYLNDIESILKALQEATSSPILTPNTNEEKASSDFLLPLTFMLVLVTFVLVFFGAVLFAWKDNQERKTKQAEKNQNSTNSNGSEFEEMSKQFQQLMLDKFAELSKIITANRASGLSVSGITPYNANSQQNNQISAIQKSVESLPSLLRTNLQNFLTTNFSSIIPDIENIAKKIEQKNAEDIQQVKTAVEEGLNALRIEIKNQFENEIFIKNSNQDSHNYVIEEQEEYKDLLTKITKIKELEANIEKLEKDNKRLKDEKINPFSNQEKLQNQIEGLKQKLKNKESELSNSKSELQEKDSEISQLQRDKGELKNRLKQQENQIDELERDKGKLENRIEKLENQTNSSQYLLSSTSSSIIPANKTLLPQEIANLVDQYNQYGIQSLKGYATIKAKVCESGETYQKRREDSSQPLILTSDGREEYLVVSVSGFADSGYWVFPNFIKITYLLYNSTGKNLFDFNNKQPSASSNSFILKKPAKVITYQSGWKLQEKGEIEITS